MEYGPQDFHHNKSFVFVQPPIVVYETFLLSKFTVFGVSLFCQITVYIEITFDPISTTFDSWRQFLLPVNETIIYVQHKKFINDYMIYIINAPFASIIIISRFISLKENIKYELLDDSQLDYSYLHCKFVENHH